MKSGIIMMIDTHSESAFPDDTQVERVHFDSRNVGVHF